jgi:fused signal recognition particle receptor
VRGLLADCIADPAGAARAAAAIGEHVPTVIMVVGVNGAGKTTSVGKLTRHLSMPTRRCCSPPPTPSAPPRASSCSPGPSAPSRRATAPAVGRGRRQSGRDRQPGRRRPAGVTFDAVVAGRARGCDVVIADTAGPPGDAVAPDGRAEEDPAHDRQGRAGAPHEVLLVIDGNTGRTRSRRCRPSMPRST